MINKNHKNKINLLNELEIEELYGMPQFTEVDRDHFFRLDEKGHALLKTYTRLKSKVFFILQLGYFKAKKRFFKFNLDEVKEDADYVIKKHYTISIEKHKLTGNLWKENYRKQKKDILKLYEYCEWTNKIEKMSLKHLEKLIRLYPKGNDTLRELFVFFDSERIMIPSYRTLQDLFTLVFKTERMRLDAVISKVPESLKKCLDEIIKNDNGLTELNVIRMDQKDFSYTALKAEVKKAKKIASLYELCKTLIPSLEVSNNAIRYYAALAEQYTASRLRKLKITHQHLQVLCFIFNRYQEFMDNLITSFMFHMRVFMVEAKQYADEMENEFIKGVMQELPGVGQFFSWFSNSDNNEINHNITVSEFKQIGFDILPKEKQFAIANFMLGSSFDKKTAKWDYFEAQSRRITMYLRPILLTVDFEFYKNDALIVRFINLLRDYYSSDNHNSTLIQSIPSEIIEEIPKVTKAVLKNHNGEINASRLEFHIYEKMYHQIDRGRLFCNDSISYCNLDFDLVSDELVDQAKEICDEFGYQKIPVYCDERLNQVLDELENAWVRTNENINNGFNQGIKIETDNQGITTRLSSFPLKFSRVAFL